MFATSRDFKVSFFSRVKEKIVHDYKRKTIVLCRDRNEALLTPASLERSYFGSFRNYLEGARYALSWISKMKVPLWPAEKY